MKKYYLLIFTMSLIFTMTACYGNSIVNNNYNNNETIKLYIDNQQIPVIWEDNIAVKEIKNDLLKADITVSMSKYSNNEQVGSLNKTYTTDDKQITTNNGDIVLYNSSNIVLFYGSNKWAYTKLGKIDLPEELVTNILSDKNVSLRLSIN